ncbi:MAG: S8 family peptidase [Taibaiella sp.]|nr:S8 family peptidase [Taibaiella sp.]
MKKVLLSILGTVVFMGQINAQSDASKSAHLSVRTRQFLHDASKAGNKSTRIPGYIYKEIGGQVYMSAFIKVNSLFNESALSALDVHTGTHAGNIYTVQLPPDKLSALSAVAGITHIDLDMPVVPQNDQARKWTKADSAQRGIGMSYPATGRGVLTGIIDAGFDFNHPTFYDTLHGAYRVKKVWRQKVNGTPPPGYFYGNDMTDPYVIRGNGTDTSITTHGTHVAGITSGSGYGSPGNNRYRGFAYESDMAFVCIMPAPYQWAMPGTSDIIDGVNYLFNYAQSISRPCVANLSWGSSIGPHDGHSFFSEALDALTGPGKIFVCSAGNNGQDTIHLSKTFSAANNTVSTFVTFSQYLPADIKRTWLDVWGDSSKSFCLNFKLFDGPGAIDSSATICVSDTIQDYALVGSNGDTCFITVNMLASEYNGRPHAFLTFYSRTPDNICLTVKGTSGTVNMWEGYVFPPTGYYGELKKLGYSFAVDGDTKYTTSDYSSSYSAISVGAYTSKSVFTNISGATLGYAATVNGIAPFSSIGPTFDGRIKPDITGPGLALASSISSFDTSYLPTGGNYNSVICTSNVGGKDYSYAMAAGTSMSSPAVSGVIAMMLQMNPTLTPDSAKAIIAKTAIKDGYTGVIPAAGTNTWGHGKINAYAALKYMDQLTMVENTLENSLACIAYPNPAGNEFSVNFESKEKKSLDVSLFDLTGRLMNSEKWQVSSGGNTRTFSLARIPAGLYLLKVTEPGGNFKTIRIEHR